MHTNRKSMRFGAQQSCKTAKRSGFDFATPEWPRDFYSNFADKTSFAAISFILPFVSAVSAFGYMPGTGGAALIAKTLGEQQREKANQLFSLLILFTMKQNLAGDKKAQTVPITRFCFKNL